MSVEDFKYIFGNFLMASRVGMNAVRQIQMDFLQLLLRETEAVQLGALLPSLKQLGEFTSVFYSIVGRNFHPGKQSGNLLIFGCLDYSFEIFLGLFNWDSSKTVISTKGETKKLED